MPLTDLPTNVPFQSTNLSNAVFSSPNNKENFTAPKSSNGTSNIPVRTPSKDPKNGNSLTPKLRRGHLFSKSSSDLLTGSQRTQLSKPGYMAATTASKFRGTGPDTLFVEPSAPLPSGSSSRFVSSSNPFK